MTGRLVVMPDPYDANAVVRFRHDNGLEFDGHAETVANVPAFVIPFDRDLPAREGGRLFVGKSSYHGILMLDEKNGITNSALFAVDIFPYTRPFDPRRLPRLVTRGQFFALETGERFTAKQCSDFNLLARWIQEGPDAVEPVLQQRASLGFNLLRVWTFMQLSQYGIGDLNPHNYPDFYSRIVPEFAGHCASHGLYIEFTAYTGSPGREDRSHWTNLGAAAQQCTNVILELVNENDQAGNALDANAFSPIPGILCSHGSNGSQAQPVQPFWNYATFHTNGASEEQRKIGHNAWEIWNGPTLTNETSRFPEVGMWSGASPERRDMLAADSAEGAALLCAGCCFHSVLGKRSALFDPPHVRAAGEWTSGMDDVPLEYQEGRYIHRDDLEPAGVLRTYERRLNDGRGHIVEIRA